jgi:hypothetical protein
MLDLDATKICWTFLKIENIARILQRLEENTLHAFNVTTSLSSQMTYFSSTVEKVTPVSDMIPSKHQRWIPPVSVKTLLDTSMS